MIKKTRAPKQPTEFQPQPCWSCGATKGHWAKCSTRPGDTAVSSRDMWLLLLSSLRYAMGRQSYIVSDIRNMIVQYHEVLSNEQLAQIAREIDHELDRAHDRGHTLGADFDESVWVGLAAYCREKAK